METRTLPIGLRTVILIAVLGAACGSSSTTKPDGGGNDAVGDHLTTSNLLVGTINADAPPPCLTEPLLLVGGQAQCTVVEHRMATAGVIDTAIPSCDTASQGPCWSLVTSPSTCPDGGLTFTFDPDPANPNPNPSTISYGYSCQLRSN